MPSLPPTTTVQLLTDLSSSLELAVSHLQAGRVVAFPTETVYGLGANALDANAVSGIFAAKGRPSDNPLIVHISDLEMLQPLVTGEIPVVYKELIANYWPGPLTLLFKKSDLVPDIVTCGHATVAIRMPAHPTALALIRACGFPLAAPSANTSGRPSPTIAAHVLDDLNGRIPLILDGGQCKSGVESTVVDGLSCIPSILRPGGVTLSQVKGCSGFENVRVWSRDFRDDELELAPTTPGMKYKHYSPNCHVVLVKLCISADKCHQRLAVDRLIDEYLLQDQNVVGVIRTGDTNDASSHTGHIEMHIGDSSPDVAHGIFKALRDMEKKGASIIIVEGIPEVDEGLAVMNRLHKAASEVRDYVISDSALY